MDEEKDPSVEGSEAISGSATSLTTNETQEGGSGETQLAIASHDTIPAIHSYQIKPILADKFKAAPVKEIIRNILADNLSGKVYDPENVKRWTVDLANEISFRVTELKLKRYKHIVQVILGEHRGAGVKSGVRCLWDAETDGYTSEIFTNDTIFCLAVVYAIYLY